MHPLHLYHPRRYCDCSYYNYYGGDGDGDGDDDGGADAYCDDFGLGGPVSLYRRYIQK